MTRSKETTRLRELLTEFSLSRDTGAEGSLGFRSHSAGGGAGGPGQARAEGRAGGSAVHVPASPGERAARAPSAALPGGSVGPEPLPARTKARAGPAHRRRWEPPPTPHRGAQPAPARGPLSAARGEKAAAPGAARLPAPSLAPSPSHPPAPSLIPSPSPLHSLPPSSHLSRSLPLPSLARWTLPPHRLPSPPRKQHSQRHGVSPGAPWARGAAGAATHTRSSAHRPTLAWAKPATAASRRRDSL